MNHSYFQKFVPLAQCQDSSVFKERATTQQLRDIFNQFADVEKEGEKYLSFSAFVQNYLGLLKDENANKDSINLIAGIVDTSKDGLISFSEFQAFEGLLCLPDALYQTAFHLFDVSGNGVISYKDFETVIKRTQLCTFMDLNSSFMKLYFGEDKSRKINYVEFSQFLHDFHEECGIEAFRKFDKKGTGYISALDFEEIMKMARGHLLTPDVRDNLVAAAAGGSGGYRVSFPYMMAFTSLLSNMELVKRVYLNTTGDDKDKEVTKEEFLYSAQMMSQITPLEVDILFILCHLIYQRGKLLYSDLQAIAPEQYTKHISQHITEIHYVNDPTERGVFIQLLESGYRFTLGSVAGVSIGFHFLQAGFSQVMFTNPLEIVKIRLQVAGEVVAAPATKISAWSIVKELGFMGLYKGARACMLRDVPFSAIYFPAYNHTKKRFADENGYNHPLTLLAAGCIAGIPAASLVTPADVVARQGQTVYSGVVDCARKIYQEEVARMFRSSPQFGVTLVMYELFQRLFYIDFGGSRPSGSENVVPEQGVPDELYSTHPAHVGGYQVALPILAGIEAKFGLCLPKTNATKPS
ncbi:hypothetical protein M8J76_015557 [Diaphorina citri]|nr:hypothetical protein M8J76_015557 [Diaphorina citri]